MRKLDLFINHEERDERGQSLVEFVLVLPIILLMIAGVLEVTNILLVYNNVQQAAREGARYAAGGGVDNGVDDVVLDTITNNLDESNVNSIWIIRPMVKKDTAASAADWYEQGLTSGWKVDEVCVYPKPCTDTSSGLDEGIVRLNIDGANAKIPSGRDSMIQAIDGEILTVVVVNYEAQTILNLSFFDYFGPGGTLPLQAWTVMRQEIESETLEKFNSGCSAYPIAINLEHETGGTKIGEAREGDWFVIDKNTYSYTGFAEGYGFLDWDANPGGGNPLETDLLDPSTSTTTFVDAIDGPSDDTLHRDDYVMASNGSPGGALANHMDKERALRVIGYTYDAGNNPWTDPYLNRVYKVDEFLIVKIIAINVDTITFEFVRMDNSCGYDLE